MALDGIITTNGYDNGKNNVASGRKYSLGWKVTAQSIADNTSTIYWSINCGGGNDDWYAEYEVEAKIDWDGVDPITLKKKTNRVVRYAKTGIFTGYITVPHNADGTRSFSLSLRVACYTATVNLTASDSFTLDTIARASQPSLVTWPQTTENVGNFGETFSIHMNRAADVFTHTVRYAYGSRTGTIATGVGTGTTWAVPLDFMNDIPESTKASGLIYVDTYSGSTLVGTKYTGFTVTVPTSVKPSASLTLDDITGVDDIYGSPVQSLSKIKVKVNTTKAYSSPIASYLVTANGVQYTTEESTTDVLTKAGDSPVTATVKDKRGRSGSASYTMKVLAYTPPVISSLTVRRCDEDGTENDQGEYVQVRFGATVTSLSSKNTATYTLKYKKTTTTTWTTVTLTAYANVYSVSNGSAIFAADSNASYDVELTVADRHNSASRITSASTAFTLINWGANGTSMAIGKVAEKANAVELGLRAYDQYGTHISNGMSLYNGTNMYDADTTTEHLVLTKKGTPSTDLLWYVETIFYSTKLVTSDRRQIAMPYRRGGSSWSRYYTNGAWSAWESEALAAYPVGSIYIAYNHTDPTTLFGGTWTRITNAFLWATTSGGIIGQTGGEQTVTLTVEQLPSHSHGSVYSGNVATEKKQAWYTASGTNLAYGAVATGGGAAHNNMPPYIQVSVWRRTA